MSLAFQRGFFFSSISTLWRSIARLATCRFIFFHFFHSYTLIIRYDLPPDPWSDLPKVLLCFSFLFFYVVSMFGLLLCCVGFGFTFTGVWHRRDGFFMGYMGWYQIRLDSSTSRSNHLLLLRISKLFSSCVFPLYYTTVPKNNSKCMSLCPNQFCAWSIRPFGSPLVWQLADLQCTWHYLGWTVVEHLELFVCVCICMHVRAELRPWYHLAGASLFGQPQGSAQIMLCNVNGVTRLGTIWRDQSLLYAAGECMVCRRAT